LNVTPEVGKLATTLILYNVPLVVEMGIIPEMVCPKLDAVLTIVPSTFGIIGKVPSGEESCAVNVLTFVPDEGKLPSGI